MIPRQWAEESLKILMMPNYEVRKGDITEWVVKEEKLGAYRGRVWYFTLAYRGEEFKMRTEYYPNQIPGVDMLLIDKDWVKNNPERVIE